jgi:hypothetical protein
MTRKKPSKKKTSSKGSVVALWPGMRLSQQKTVWIVMQYTSCYWPMNGRPSYHFDFCGVFETEKEAVAACRDENYFVGPAVCGACLPHEPVPWPGAYYPLKKSEGGE